MIIRSVSHLVLIQTLLCALVFQFSKSLSEFLCH